jgi:hypothetical protein
MEQHLSQPKSISFSGMSRGPMRPALVRRRRRRIPFCLVLAFGFKCGKVSPAEICVEGRVFWLFRCRRRLNRSIGSLRRSRWKLIEDVQVENRSHGCVNGRHELLELDMCRSRSQSTFSSRHRGPLAPILAVSKGAVDALKPLAVGNATNCHARSLEKHLI